ncbi:MAG: Hsp20/alpha crystallin family protein [Oscillospiraceae bacterium]|nr:Hsp20/alpha crystallin family protein [Oscillospiraceae bacterium]
MFVPELFRKNDWDEFFEHPFHMPVHASQNNPMKTDVKETPNSYEFAIDLPNVKKEDVKAELHDGCLTISASTIQNHDEQDKNGNYIRRERFRGSYSRSFYIGDSVKEQDIQAKFTDGVLNLSIPKKEPVTPEKKYISID